MGKFGYRALLLGILGWLLWKDFFQVAIVCGAFAALFGFVVVGEIMGFDSRVHGTLAEEASARDARRQSANPDSKPPLLPDP